MKPSPPPPPSPFAGRLLRRLLGWLVAPCAEMARLASESCDRPLTPRERLRLRLHGLICRWCRRYARQIAWLHAAAPRLLEEPPQLHQRAMPEEFRDRLKRRLRDEPRA